MGKECKECKKIFPDTKEYYYTFPSSGYVYKICHTCRLNRLKKYKKICLCCGKEFKAWEKKGKFCSKHCASKTIYKTRLIGKEGILLNNNGGHKKYKKDKNLEKKRLEKLREFNTIHGMTDTRFYNIWCGIKVRCLTKGHHSYKYYGASGIKISKRWLSFENFKKDMFDEYLKHVDMHGEKNTTIDRINPYGDYTKNNCRWATHKIQASNKKIHYKK